MFVLGQKTGRVLVAIAFAVGVPLIGNVVAASAVEHLPLRTAIEARVAGAQGITSPLGVLGTTAADLESFAAGYNAQRVEHGLATIPAGNFRYDACMEQRLFWMAEDPSDAVASAWGHLGSVRSDGVPSVGCDGNLAGGTGNTGESVATKWWNSPAHREALYKPFFTGSLSSVCISFAMTHGGIPDEPVEFTRAAASWSAC